MKRLILITMLMLIPAMAQAREYTLEECIGIALKENSGLKASEAAAAAAGEESAISRAALLPSLRIRALYSLIDRPERLIINQDTFVQGIPPQDVEISTGNRASYEASVIIDQPLFTGGRLASSLSKARKTGNEALLDAGRQKRLLVHEVKRLFYNALNSRLQREAAEKIAAAKGERFRVLQDLYTEGYLPREDMVRQEADLLLAEAELYRSTSREELDVSRLCSRLALQEGAVLVPAGSPRNLVLTAKLEEVVQAAVENREELKMAQSRIGRAEDEVRIARSDYFPQAWLQGKYTRQKETNIQRPNVWTVSARLDWSLFEWGKTTAEVRKRVALRQQAAFELDDRARQVRLDVESFWRELKEKEKMIQASEREARAFELLARLTADRYAEGTVRLVEVVDAEAELIKAYKQYLREINDLNSAIAGLELATAGYRDEWFEPASVYTPDLDAFTASVRALQKNVNKPVDRRP